MHSPWAPPAGSRSSSSPTSSFWSRSRAAESSCFRKPRSPWPIHVADALRKPAFRVAGGILLVLLTLLAVADPAMAQQTGALDRAVSTIAGDGKPLSLSLQILLLMSLLTVLPSLVLMMTSFTRIIIVLSILRQALGLQQTPPNQVLVGLALFLSLFVMRPAIDQINANAFKPYGDGQIGIEEAITRSATVLHGFMIRQTRQTDLKLFADL